MPGKKLFNQRFVQVQGKRLGIGAGKGKAEGFKRPGHQGFTVGNPGQAFAPVENNVLIGTEGRQVRLPDYRQQSARS